MIPLYKIGLVFISVFLTVLTKPLLCSIRLQTTVSYYKLLFLMRFVIVKTMMYTANKNLTL